MPRMIDQIRANRVPSNMMQFAARGALSVSPSENLEILVYLAKNNKVFGDLARMTLAGWDLQICAEAAANPHTPREVLDYLVAPDNLRPQLFPALLENVAVRRADGQRRGFRDRVRHGDELTAERADVEFGIERDFRDRHLQAAAEFGELGLQECRREGRCKHRAF